MAQRRFQMLAFTSGMSFDNLYEKLYLSNKKVFIQHSWYMYQNFLQEHNISMKISQNFLNNPSFFSSLCAEEMTRFIFLYIMVPNYSYN